MVKKLGDGLAFLRQAAPQPRKPHEPSKLRGQQWPAIDHNPLVIALLLQTFPDVANRGHPARSGQLECAFESGDLAIHHRAVLAPICSSDFTLVKCASLGVRSCGQEWWAVWA
jgi:hypothetical protein